MNNNADIKALLRHAFDAQGIIGSGWAAYADDITIFLDVNPDNNLGLMIASKEIEDKTKMEVDIAFVESLSPAAQSRMRETCVHF